MNCMASEVRLVWVSCSYSFGDCVSVTALVKFVALISLSDEKGEGVRLNHVQKGLLVPKTHARKFRKNCGLPLYLSPGSENQDHII